jgi:hypothetical protein
MLGFLSGLLGHAPQRVGEVDLWRDPVVTLHQYPRSLGHGPAASR